MRSGKLPFNAIKNRNKYRNIENEYDGIKFDSKKERNRYIYLKSLQEEGIISDLRVHVKFELSESVREADTVGVRGGIKKGKVILTSTSYIADFVYIDSDGKMIVEDTKSEITKTSTYQVKKKWLYQKYKILISEV